jgi:uncharacterized protein DUF3800
VNKRAGSAPALKQNSFGMSKNREPRPHEAHLFNEIYIDETSQNDQDFLLIGSIMLPRQYGPQLEADIIQARLPDRPLLRSTGEPRELKWSEFGKRDLAVYKRVVDVFFHFRRHFPNLQHKITFQCSVVNCRIKGRRYATGEKGQLGFNREIYYHCLSLARRDRDHLFHVYPDYRTTNMTMQQMRLILQRTMTRDGDKRDWPFRRIQFRRSHEWQTLQLVDILLGAVAYKLNGHYDAPEATPEKKALCDYIIAKAKCGMFVKRGKPLKKPWHDFQIWIRQHRD